MEAVTKRRIIWIVAAMLLAYAASLLLIGLSVSFNHSLPQWLLSGGLIALAIGMTASALLRVEVMLDDREMRRRLWSSAGPLTRFWRVLSLGLQIGLAIVMWLVALGLARR